MSDGYGLKWMYKSKCYIDIYNRNYIFTTPHTIHHLWIKQMNGLDMLIYINPNLKHCLACYITWRLAISIQIWYPAWPTISREDCQYLSKFYTLLLYHVKPINISVLMSEVTPVNRDYLTFSIQLSTYC